MARPVRIRRSLPPRHSGQASALQCQMNSPEQANISASLDHPPKGTWFLQDGVEFEVGVATRSVTAILFGLFMCVFSVFPLCGINAVLSSDSRQVKGGIIFALITMLCDLLVLIWIFGKVVVRVDSQGGTIFTGLGRVGLKRRFNWEDVSAIRIIDTGEFDYRITIEGKRRISFGWQLDSERREFMVTVLNELRRHYRGVATASTALSEHIHRSGKSPSPLLKDEKPG